MITDGPSPYGQQGSRVVAPPAAHQRHLLVGHCELDSLGLPTPEMSPLELLEDGAATEAVFFPQHVQEEALVGGWSGFQQTYQHYVQGYAPNGSASYGPGSGLSVSSVSSRDSRLESSGLASILAGGRLNTGLRSPNPAPPDSVPSPTPFPEPTRCQQQQHQTQTSTYFGQMLGNSAPSGSYYMQCHLGQLSPPPEPPVSSSCSSMASPQPPTSFPSPSPLHHLSPSPADFWPEADRHPFDQYVSCGRSREEAFGRGGGLFKVQGGRVGSTGEDGSSPLISALSDASSAVYYSACISG